MKEQDAIAVTSASKAFISHAGPDGAVARLLYDGLAARGIRPTLDERDFLLGDDVIDSIFSRGAERIWQQAEISAATVRAVEEGTRLITVIVGDLPASEIPLFLRTKFYARLEAVTKTEILIDDIAHAIHQDRPSPTIAPAPAWKETAVAGLLGLEPVDEIVLRYVCEQHLRQEYPAVQTGYIETHCRGLQIPRNAFETSLSLLLSRSYLKAATAPRGTMFPWSVAPSGLALERYLLAYCGKDYTRVRELAIGAMCEMQLGDLDAVVERCDDAERRLVEHIAEELDRSGDIDVQHVMGGLRWYAKPSLRRYMR